ncbi:NmrA-like family protein [Ascodesmis nigricans]|uniref:NmrA-like family protein n=1 Tax=Ascodesmis nigricans TaxID=341454 RepID=A0A4S2N7J9_9PEZI|nr:NmrA-like family protein [Ascodesmis nigricans]
MVKAVLITGATGKQGGAVVNSLLEQNADLQILAVTRNATSPSALRLKEKSDKIKLVQGNLDDPEDIFQKAKDVAEEWPIEGVFSVQAPLGPSGSTAKEETQGKALITAALNNNVRHFVYTSVDRGGALSSDNATNIPHFISKHHIEQHLFNALRSSPQHQQQLTYTILRPVAFFDNLTPDFIGRAFASMIAVSLLPHDSKKLQFIAVSDIGYFGAAALIHPENPVYKNQAISLAGDEVSYDELRKVFREKTGKELPVTWNWIARLMLWGVKELGTMFRWFGEKGYGADIGELRKVYPGLKDLGAWLERDSKFETKAE